MKKIIILLLLLTSFFALSGCKKKEDPYTIKISASENPHAKILNEVVKPILKESGYNLEVTVLDWTIQNDALSFGEYDANYFQHIPYLNTYKGKTALTAICKVHYEVLCLYASSLSHKEFVNGDTIEVVNDPSNFLRALRLLESYEYLDVTGSLDENGELLDFDSSNPEKHFTWKEKYNKSKIVCLKEAQLPKSLSDYSFGIIPGNTALTGLGSSYKERIALSEKNDLELIKEKANVIVVRQSDISNPKTIALIKALGDERVGEYIKNTFGSSVLYYYEKLV